MHLCSRILSYGLPELVHKYENGDQKTCTVFEEFVVAIPDPKLDGYDLRNLQCRWVGCATWVFGGVHMRRGYFGPRHPHT